MTSTIIRQKLYEYIKVADDKKLKAIYTLLAPIDHDITKWWQDKKMVEELKQQNADMESGKDKGVSWDVAKEHLLLKLKK